MTSFRNSKIFDGISVLVASGIGNFSMLAGKVICKKVRELGGECEMVNRKERSDIERFKYIYSIINAKCQKKFSFIF